MPAQNCIIKLGEIIEKSKKQRKQNISADTFNFVQRLYKWRIQRKGKGLIYLRIYLDNCCYNRPYDDQTQFKVTMETRAKLHIQEAIKNQQYILVSSFMLEYENSKNSDDFKRKMIHDYQTKYSSFYVPFERCTSLQDKVNEIMSYGIHYKDAVHTACAIYAKCKYLLTTDIKFQKHYKGNEIIILNPIEFIQITEEEE